MNTDPRARRPRPTAKLSNDCSRGAHYLCDGCGCVSGCHREPWPFACAPEEPGDKERLFAAVLAGCPEGCEGRHPVR